MADLIKTFHAYGKYFEDDLLESFNQFSSKKIDKILHIELSDYSYDLKDPSTIKDRLILYITSSAGGNLFPFVFLSEKLFDIEAKGKVKKGAIKKSFDNMKKYLTKEELQELEPIYNNIDFEKLKALVESEVENRSDSKENWYIALSFDGEFFNERFPDVFTKRIKTKGSELSLNGHCFIDENASKIGFDVGLNFCSVDNLSKGMQTKVKPRLLPISNEAGGFVKLGFEKIFNDFKFKLFGLNYILLPTVFDSSLNSEIFDEVNASKKNDYDQRAVDERVMIEEDLEELVEELDKKNLTNELLFTMLFYEKGTGNELIVSHTIEDVVPSRIATAKELMREYNIDASKLSKYEKKVVKEKNLKLIYIQDYINDKLFLAKLLFAKEKINNNEIYLMIYRKIFYGDNYNCLKKENKSDKNVKCKNRELSKILSQKTFFDKSNDIGYSKDDTNFKKHQEFLKFLSDEKLKMGQYIELGGDMKFENVKELIAWKYENVEILKIPTQKEFYVMGMFCRLVIAWQKANNDSNSSLESYLNTIGTVNALNIESVYRKVIDGAGKYKVFGKNYDYLLTLYSEIKSLQKSSEKVSNDKANILFVMGFTDYRNLPKVKRKEN